MSRIINADDFGLSNTVNEAIKICFEKGYIDRTTIMVNMPSFNDALLVSEENGFKGKVGLHLNLDEGVPLSAKIKNNPHFCKDGLFISGCFRSTVRKFFLSQYDRVCLEDEIGLQMKTYCNAGFTLMHIDSHHLVHTSSPAIVSIVCRLAKKYGFVSMRTVAVYPHDNFIRRIAKKYVKKKVLSSFMTTVNFAPLSEINNKESNIEYMSHPDIVNNIVVDVLDRDTSTYRNISDYFAK